MSIHVTVSNPPPPAKPEHCQSQGCKREAQKRWYSQWLCNWHFYRAFRDAEMNNEPEAA